MATNKQKLVVAICDFLNASIKDGSIKADDREGVEIAVQCITEAFGVDASDKSLSIAPATLSQVFDVFIKTSQRASTGASPSPAAGPSSPSTSTATPAAAAAASRSPTAADKKKAETLKGEGNTLMASKDHKGAIAKYTEAIKLDATSPIYFSNRAAARSAANEHEQAIDDARAALALDSKFSKAYSRLGVALFSTGRYAEAVDAYESGLKLDPTNATMKSSLAKAKQRADELNDMPPLEDDAEDEAADAEDASPAARGAPGAGPGGMDFAAMANNPMIRQMAESMGLGGAGGGGMPDLSQLMSNPMVQQMMSNPAMMQSMMSMLGGGGGGGQGMPDLSALAGMLGGAGRGRGGRGNGRGSSDMYS